MKKISAKWTFLRSISAFLVKSIIQNAPMSEAMESINFYGQYLPIKDLLIDEESAQSYMDDANFNLLGLPLGELPDRSNSSHRAKMSEDLKCMMSLQNFTTNILRYPFWNMVDNTASDLLDMGSASGCDKLGRDISKYVVMEMEFSNGISSFKAASCVPSECS